MHKHVKIKKVTLFTLVIAMLFSTFIATGMAATDAWEGAAKGETIVKDTITKISEGVTEHKVVSQNAQGQDQKIDFLCEIKPSDTLKVKAGYGKDNADSWSLTPTTKQAAAYEKNHPGETVVAGINADFFNMANGAPMGALVIEGKKYNDASGRWYFGVTKDGKSVIRNSEDLSDLDMAVGGDQVLVKDGKPVEESNAYGEIKYSRTAIGIKPDGTIVTFVTHGLQPPVSNGRTYKEMGEMFAAEGCEIALALDGGGSSTYAGRPEGTKELVVRNNPADGAERAVSSSILIVSKAEKTGVFSHAQLSPNNEVYTPNSKVDFDAKGVDTAGFAMDLPGGVKFKLADNSKDLGTIDESTGVFKSNDKTGKVTVNLLKDNKVVGETTIEIAVPDQISFASEEVSLGFEQSSDLGLIVRSKGRDVNYKDGDFDWNLSEPKLGTFKGNVFTSSDGESLTGTATAVSVHDKNVKGTIKVIVGKLPVTVWDFEDVKNEDGSVTSASDYYIGNEETPGILSTKNYGRGGKESVEIADIQSDEPVRFGSKSLKLNYDFRECGAVTEGACIGTSKGMEIPGVPTAIGVWVYAPEGVGIEYKGEGSQAGFWLRGYVGDGSGANIPYNFTLEPKNEDVVNGKAQPGIYWEGWKYLEADLTKVQPPYTIQPNMTLRLMYVSGTKMGTKTADSIYFDNLQFVYGTNMDDVDEPKIKSITVNGKELESGATINEDTVTIESIYEDVQNKYTSGIDLATVRMYIDGENVVDNDRYQFGKTDIKAQLNNLKLSNGVHTIAVAVRDKFGNETKDTRYFIVDNGKTNEKTTVEVVPAEKSAVLGETVNLQIKASDNTVDTSKTVIQLGNMFKEYEVKYSKDFEGTDSYSKFNKTITIKANRKTDENGTVSISNEDNVIATLSVKVPSNLKPEDKFTYTVKNGNFLTLSKYYDTFSTTEKSMNIVAPYNISVDPVIVGESDAVIKVTDINGKLVPEVGIYKEDNSLIGKTNEKGELVTNIFNGTAGTYVIYAKDDKGALSFQYKLEVYDAQGENTGSATAVRFNITKDPSTQKSITWLSSPLKDSKQVINYRVEGSNEWTTVDAKTQKKLFNTGGNKISNVNGVELKGLTPNTTYEYQLGTENAMSEVKKFTTDGSANNFFIIGDIQDPENLTNLEKIVDQLGSKYDFGIQIGDAVDNAANYDEWKSVGNLVGANKLGDTEVLSVMGNHEYYGDADADIAAAMYNHPNSKEGGYFSVERGDVYIASINFATTKSQIQEAINWLKEDAKKSNAKWKILTSHQPPYYTNSVGGNDLIYDMFPDAVEEAGIDLVFSGHDHSVGRTNMLKDDKINEKDGVVYYLCGAAGSKRYPMTTQDKFDYKTIFHFVEDSYGASYLTATVADEEINIDVRDVTNGALLDSFTLESKCKRNGHKNVYDPKTNEVKCDVCHKVDDKFSGAIKDKDGNEYYLRAGKPVKSEWVIVDKDVAYYGANGIKEKLTIEEKKSTCLVDGYIKYTSESGAVKQIDYIDAGGHDYQKDGEVWTCRKCGTVSVKMSDTKVSLSYDKCTWTGKGRTPATTAIAPDGRKLANKGEGRDYYSTYKNNVDVGEATVTLTAAKYGIYVDLNDWRGNCRGSIKAHYTIHPDAPKNAVVKMDGKTANVTWEAAKAADEYVVYQSINGEAWEEIGATKYTSFEVQDVNDMNSYRFRVYSRAEGKKANGEIASFDSLTSTTATLSRANLVVKASNRPVDGKPQLDWNKLANADSYQVYRSVENKVGTFYKLSTTKGTHFVNTSAKSGETYYYKVRPVSKDGKVGAFGDVVKIKCSPTILSLKTDNLENGTPTLEWAKVKGDVRYELYKSKANKAGTFSRVYSGSKLMYKDTSAKEGTTYYYKIRVVSNSGIYGEFSKVVSNKVRYMPLKIKTINRDVDGVPVIKWNKVPNTKAYEVYRSTENKKGTFKKLFTAKKGTSLINTSAKPGTTYYYKVRRVSATGAKGSFSNVVKNSVKPAEIKATISLRSKDGKPIIKWTKVVGAEKYEVYRSTVNKKGTFKKLYTAKGTSLTNTSAKKGTKYYYKVRAISKSAKGTFSNVVGVKVR